MNNISRHDIAPDYIVQSVEAAARQAQCILRRDHGLTVRLLGLRNLAFSELERNVKASGGIHPSPLHRDLIEESFRSLLIEKYLTAEPNGGLTH